MKEKLNQIKEVTGKLSGRTKKIAIVVLTSVIIFSVALAFLLNHKSYGVLFTGLNAEEAQQIIGRLNEEEVAFQYDEGGTILVEEGKVDELKAQLVYEGYPQSGFTYDVFTSNAGLMSTDSDKQTYLLYQLQERIGATIRMFEGVKEARVTVALGEKEKYALSDEDEEESSATAVVIMKDGGSPDKKQAEAIQRLVARSVPGMKMENVSVFDGNGNEVSVKNPAQAAADGERSEEIAGIVENQINARILNVLEPVYGEGSVRVSAKAKINMEKLLTEATTYTTPDKTGADDKTGIVSSETTAEESSEGGTPAQGTAGTESNAEAPEYDTQDTGTGSRYSSESATREYLVNQLKEQGQIDPGTLEDLTVSVLIDGEDFGNLSQEDLLGLIGNAAGIEREQWQGKISVVSAPFYRGEAVPEESEEEEKADWKMAAAVAGIGLVTVGIIAAVGIALFRKKRRSKAQKEKEAQEQAAQQALKKALHAQESQRNDVDDDHGMELRESIREFTEKNPEISAQLLKSWLNSGQRGE